MSSFFDEASLVMIPSGYKDQKVYSVKPLDGSGDLTFSRASNATRVASNGLIEKVRTNLVLQSETFETTWAPAVATITSNATTAPNGTLTADKLVAAVGLGLPVQHRIDQTPTTAAGNNTYSVYAKKGEIEFIFLRIGVAGAMFNLNNGAISSISAGIVASSVDAGNGWYRLIITKAASVANEVLRINLNLTDTFTDFIGNGTDGAFIWGAQYELNDIATDYIATTTAAVSVGPVSGLPRLDYLNSSCPRLLLEPQRTNLGKWSENFDNADWLKTSTTISANSAISPSGYQDADEATISVSGGNLRQIISVSSSTAYTFSFYVKRGTATNLKYNVRDFTNGVDITEIVDYTSQTSTTEWSRIVVSFTTPATCTSIGIYPHRNSASTGTFYIWGAQLEQGAYATSYIPTLGTSVTRVADSAGKSSISSLIGQTEGTLFVDVDVVNSQSPSGNWHICVLGSVSERITLYTTSSTIAVDGTSSTGGFGTISASLTTGRKKMAVAYAANDIAFYINGVLIGTKTSATIPTSMSDIDLGGNFTFVDFLAGNKFNQAILFPTRLSNSDLAALTA
jgi:hypothetical protein